MYVYIYICTCLKVYDCLIFARSAKYIRIIKNANKNTPSRSFVKNHEHNNDKTANQQVSSSNII